MYEKEELIMILEELRNCSSILPWSVCVTENYPVDKTTVLEDVSLDSFEWVIQKAIKYIKEH